MKISSIKNVGRSIIKIIAEVPDDAPVGLHQELAAEIEEMFQAIRMKYAKITKEDEV